LGPVSARKDGIMVIARPHAHFFRGQAPTAAAALALCLLLAGSTGATIIQVPGDQPAIQLAINVAASGDTILVAPGTYTGADNRDLNFFGKNLVLLASAGPAATIIDCEALGRGFMLTTQETVASRIEGFTIQNALVDSDGGGVLLTDAGATFVNCIFHANHGDSGGGIWCNRSALIVTDCVFTDNVASGNSQYAGYGGGLWIDRLSRATVTNSSFERNIAKRGAGVWVGGAAVVDIVDCTFTENVARSWGGGLGASGGPTSLSVSGSTFTRNSATSAGGGASCEFLSPEIMDCEFTDNTSSSRGGGVFLTNADATITGTLFAGNTADEAGGGLLCFGSSPIIRSATFYGNAAVLGGGVFVGETDNPSAALIQRSIIAFSTLGEAVYCQTGSNADLSCTDVFGNAGGDWVGCLAGQLGQDGNFALDPLFCDAAAGDFRIAINSPCAPDQSPPGCALIGAFPAGCGTDAVAGAGVSAATLRLRVVPNPIVSGGRIEWTSASSAAISLRLYDAAGRLAAERDLGPVGAGSHALAWEDAFPGRKLGSGIYFLRWVSGTTAAPAVRVVIAR
jgi:hypothetical protein